MTTTGGTDPADARPDSGDAAAVVRAHLRAFNAGDLEAVLDGMTPQALWVTGRSRARGQGELAELFGRALADLQPVLTLRSLVADGDRVACELTEVVSVGGRPRTDAIAGFYEVSGGRIAAARIYREGSAEVS